MNRLSSPPTTLLFLRLHSTISLLGQHHGNHHHLLKSLYKTHLVLGISNNSIITTPPIITNHLFHQRRSFSRRRNRRRHHRPDIDTKSKYDNKESKTNDDEGKQTHTHKPRAPMPDPDWYVEDDYGYPKTFHGWIIHIKEALIMYGRTYEGFFDRNAKQETWEEFEARILKERGIIKTDDDPKTSSDDDEEEKEVEKKLSTLERQFDDNLEEITHARDKLVDRVKERTGISDKEALKLWMEDQLRLANECLAEFMAGYREGRDKEIDNVLNEYFKDFDKEVEETGEEEREEEEEKRRERRERRRKRRKALLHRVF